jgi:integrase
VRAKRPQRLPIVLTRDEVLAVLRPLTGAPRLMAVLLYGSRLRLLECCRLRVQDIDFGQHDLQIGAGWVELPSALARKYPTPAKNGSGSGSFLQPGTTAIARPARSGVTTSTVGPSA